MRYLVLFIVASLGQRLADSPKAEKKIKAVRYLNSMYAHVHQNPSPYSSSLTTISCGHLVKVYASSKEAHGEKWEYVKAGLFTGYVLRRLLNPGPPDCLQDGYPRFYEGLDLSTTEIYYWGRLYDHYISKKTRVKR